MKFVNNYSRPVTLTQGATTLALDLPDGEYRLTLTDGESHEIVGAAVAGGGATLQRGLEGTQARLWPQGSTLYCDVTAGQLESLFARLALAETAIAALQASGGGGGGEDPGGVEGEGWLMAVLRPFNAQNTLLTYRIDADGATVEQSISGGAFADSYTFGMAVSADGTTVVLCGKSLNGAWFNPDSYYGTAPALMIDVATGTATPLPMGFKEAANVAVSADGAVVAVYNSDAGEILFWDAIGGEMLEFSVSTTTQATERLFGMGFAPDTGAFWVHGRFDVAGSPVHQLRMYGETEQIFTLGHSSISRGFAFRNGLLYLGTDNTVRVWSSAGDEPNPLDGIEGGVASISVSPTGRYMACSLDPAWGGPIVVHDFQQGVTLYGADFPGLPATAAPEIVEFDRATGMLYVSTWEGAYIVDVPARTWSLLSQSEFYQMVSVAGPVPAIVLP